MKEIKQVSVTPTISTGAYTAGDVVGGLMTFTVSDLTPVEGILRSILITDDHNQSEEYTLYVFNAVPSTIANDAAFAPTLADLKKLITTVGIASGDYTTSNSNAWALLGGHEDTIMEIHFHSDTGAIYIYAVAVATPDYNADGDLSIKITVEVL